MVLNLINSLKLSKISLNDNKMSLFTYMIKTCKL